MSENEHKSPYGRGFIAASIVIAAILLCGALLIITPYPPADHAPSTAQPRQPNAATDPGAAAPGGPASAAPADSDSALGADSVRRLRPRRRCLPAARPRATPAVPIPAERERPVGCRPATKGCRRRLLRWTAGR